MRILDYFYERRTIINPEILDKIEFRTVTYTIFHRLWASLYNLFRRPFVKAAATELEDLTHAVIAAITIDLSMRYKDLEAYEVSRMFFLSQVERYLLATGNKDIIAKYQIEFNRNQELSDFICGFKSNRK